MTNELQKRISHAENFSTDLVHEIRNPLTSLKSASEILNETNDQSQRSKLIDILNHDVQRIERLITDYSQILKDEVALSKEKMKKINLKLIARSVVDDFNKDGFKDIMVVGNHYGVEIETTRYDAGYGAIFLGNGKNQFTYSSSIKTGIYLPEDTRSISAININKKDKFYLITTNNDAVNVLKYKQ